MAAPIPDLHRFKEDLQKVPPPGSNAPPRSIRALDLDENFKKVTVIPNQVLATRQAAPDYDTDYSDEGAELLFQAFNTYVCENGEAVEYRLLGQKLEKATT